MNKTLKQTFRLSLILAGVTLLGSCGEIVRGSNLSGCTRAKHTCIHRWQAPKSSKIPLYRLQQDYWVAMEKTHYKPYAVAFGRKSKIIKNTGYLNEIKSFSYRSSKQLFVKLPANTRLPLDHNGLASVLQKSPETMDADKFMKLAPQHVGGMKWTAKTADKKRPALAISSSPKEKNEITADKVQFTPVPFEAGGFDFCKRTDISTIGSIVAGAEFVTLDVPATVVGSTVYCVGCVGYGVVCFATGVVFIPKVLGD